MLPVAYSDAPVRLLFGKGFNIIDGEREVCASVALRFEVADEFGQACPRFV